ALLFSTPSPTALFTLSLHDALPICAGSFAQRARIGSGRSKLNAVELLVASSVPIPRDTDGTAPERSGRPGQNIAEADPDYMAHSRNPLRHDAQESPSTASASRCAQCGKEQRRRRTHALSANW